LADDFFLWTFVELPFEGTLTESTVGLVALADSSLFVLASLCPSVALVARRARGLGYSSRATISPQCANPWRS
jgi:uncharacterized membrane protein YhaH (DUF805 family)